MDSQIFGGGEKKWLEAKTAVLGVLRAEVPGLGRRGGWEDEKANTTEEGR